MKPLLVETGSRPLKDAVGDLPNEKTSERTTPSCDTVGVKNFLRGHLLPWEQTRSLHEACSSGGSQLRLLKDTVGDTQSRKTSERTTPLYATRVSGGSLHITTLSNS